MLEEFVAELLISDIKDRLTPKSLVVCKALQLNSVCGIFLTTGYQISTSLASMSESVTKTLERLLRNLNMLVQKIAIGVRTSLIKWVSNFLSKHTQRS